MLMELSDGVKQGRHLDRILTGQKLFRRARPLQVLMSAALGHDVLAPRVTGHNLVHGGRFRHPARAVNSTPLR